MLRQEGVFLEEFKMTIIITGFPARNGGFNGTNSAGVRCPWRYGNLNNGANAGLAYENGNNTPSNSNWNGRPRLS